MKHKDKTTGKKYGLCTACDMKVCVTCSGKFHPKEKECPNDPSLLELKELASKEGWQRCYQCKAMVELRAGCNHMTCRCGAQFCMLCGTRWRECNCVMFNDEYIDRIRDEERNGGGGGAWGAGGMPGAWENLVWNALRGDMRGDNERHAEWRRRHPRPNNDDNDNNNEDDWGPFWRDPEDLPHRLPPPRRGYRPGGPNAWPEDVRQRPADPQQQQRPLDADEELAHWLHDAQLRGEDPDEWVQGVGARAGREWHARAHAVLADEGFVGDREREADGLIREMNAAARGGGRRGEGRVNVMNFLEGEGGNGGDDDDDDEEDADYEEQTRLAQRVREARRR